MKKILFGLTVLAAAASTPAAYAFPTCVSFAPAGYCDAMQFDGENAATWIKYDCSNSSPQTSANYTKGKTNCKASSGCEPSTSYGWTWLKWKFNMGSSTGTLTGKTGGTKYVLQQDMPVAISEGACTAANLGKSGTSVLSR
jgi:hypothetical protein